ncbi:MAG: diaminopimelate decarboxylase [Actinobacteria bacterium]|nr:diaminopimelate decarboxylase [Actinomycetota bacterium]
MGPAGAGAAGQGEAGRLHRLRAVRAAQDSGGPARAGTAPFPRTAVFDGPRLVAVGGVDVVELARRHGTPLYVLDHAELAGRMREYRAALGADVDVAYAAKALCVVGVLQVAAAEGLGVDVASEGELVTAHRAGVPMGRVVFHGNNKSVDELAAAGRLGVGRVVVDSFAELDRLERVGRRLGHVFDVLVRVTPGVRAGTHAFVRTGHDDTKFGFTLSAGLAGEAVARAGRCPHVRLRGAHCHVGSQILGPGAFEDAAAVLTGFLADVRDAHGVVLEELNLGGGLGIAYRRGDRAPVVADYGARLVQALRVGASARGLPEPRLAVEPGRSIVGPAGITLYTVGTVKDVPGGRRWVSVDGGMSDNVRPALYGASYEVAAAGPAAGSGGGAGRAAVVGKHCESGDVLAPEARLPDGVAEGTLLAVAATGAYGHVMASNYNRLPRPAMVLVGGGRSDVLVRRETVDDVLAHDVSLPAEVAGAPGPAVD